MSQEVTELQNGSYRVMGSAQVSKVFDFFDIDKELALRIMPKVYPGVSFEELESRKKDKLMNEVERMKAEAQANEAADKAERERVDKLNQADSMIFQTENFLKENGDKLGDDRAGVEAAVQQLKANPSSATFETAAKAWMTARQPWEMSEAFLFGPVDELGLDPNMDSWPLDQDAIKNVLKSGDFSGMDWEGDYEGEDEGGSMSQRLPHIGVPAVQERTTQDSRG